MTVELQQASPKTPKGLYVDGLVKSYPPRKGSSTGRVLVLNSITLSVAEGELVSIFGPNGCGKTSLLRIIAGLMQPDSGLVQIGGQTDRSTKVGFVFQNYGDSLLPWCDVLDNVAFPLELCGMRRKQRRMQAREMLGKLGIKLAQGAYPYQLSGGQQQLVAIARALILSPNALLLDEPFGSLDYWTRLRMEQTLQEIYTKLSPTTLFVSHDLDEALLLADRVLLLSQMPAQVLEEIRVDAGRPRPPSWLVSDEFRSLKMRALDVLGEEFVM